MKAEISNLKSGAAKGGDKAGLEEINLRMQVGELQNEIAGLKEKNLKNGQSEDLNEKSKPQQKDATMVLKSVKNPNSDPKNDENEK